MFLRSADGHFHERRCLAAALADWYWCQLCRSLPNSQSHIQDPDSSTCTQNHSTLPSFLYGRRLDRYNMERMYENSPYMGFTDAAITSTGGIVALYLRNPNHKCAITANVWTTSPLKVEAAAILLGEHTNRNYLPLPKRPPTMGERLHWQNSPQNKPDQDNIDT